MTNPVISSNPYAQLDEFVYICEILKKDGLQLQHYPGLACCKDVVLIAVRQNPDAFEFADDGLKNDLDFIAQLFFDPRISFNFLKFAADTLFSLQSLQTLSHFLAHSPDLINIVFEKNNRVFWHCVSINPNLVEHIGGDLSQESYESADNAIKENAALAIALLDFEKIDRGFVGTFFSHVKDKTVLPTFVEKFPEVFPYLFESHPDVFIELLRKDFTLIDELYLDLDVENCSEALAQVAIEKGVSEFVKINPSLRLHAWFFPVMFQKLSLEDQKAYLATYENEDIDPDQFEFLLNEHIIHENPDFYFHLDDKYKGSFDILQTTLTVQRGRLENETPSALFYASPTIKNNARLCSLLYTQCDDQGGGEAKRHFLLKDIPDHVLENPEFWLPVFDNYPEDFYSQWIPGCLKYSIQFNAQVYDRYHEREGIVSKIPSWVYSYEFWFEVLKLDVVHFQRPMFAPKLKHNLEFLKLVTSDIPELGNFLPKEYKVMICMSKRHERYIQLLESSSKKAKIGLLDKKVKIQRLNVIFEELMKKKYLY